MAVARNFLSVVRTMLSWFDCRQASVSVTLAWSSYYDGVRASDDFGARGNPKGLDCVPNPVTAALEDSFIENWLVLESTCVLFVRYHYGLILDKLR